MKKIYIKFFEKSLLKSSQFFWLFNKNNLIIHAFDILLLKNLSLGLSLISIFLC